MISDSYWTNPQYFFTLKKSDKSSENPPCVIIVALLQKHRRTLLSLGLKRKPEEEDDDYDEEGKRGPNYRRIGFDLYRVRPFSSSGKRYGAIGLILLTVDGSSKSYHLNCSSRK